MKIAVAGDGKAVAQHFGHCEGFHIFSVQEDKVSGSQFVQNPGHKPGFLPNYLNDLGVNVIIAGGMGGAAIQLFSEKGIKVITGAAGNAADAVGQLLEGKLESAGSVCHEHQHHGTCGGH